MLGFNAKPKRASVLLDALGVRVVPNGGQALLQFGLMMHPEGRKNRSVALWVTHERHRKDVLLRIPTLAHVLRVIPRQVNVVDLDNHSGFQAGHPF